MKRLLAAIRERRSIVHDAEVTLSGLRVRYADGREPEVVEWWRLRCIKNSTGRFYWDVLDGDGNPVGRDGRTMHLQVRGDEQLRLAQRAHYRGLKQALTYSENIITETSRSVWFPLIFSWSMALLMLYAAIQFIGKAYCGVRSHLETPVYPDEFMISGLLLIFPYILLSVLFFLVFIYLGTQALLEFPFNLKAAQFSKKGLTCIRKNKRSDFHAWHDLLPEPRENNRMRFSNGFTIRLNPDRRGHRLCCIIHEIHYPVTACKRNWVSPRLRIVIYSILTVVACSGVGYISQYMGNIPYDPLRGLKLGGLSFCLVVLLLAIMAYHPRFERWARSRERARRHMKNALRRKGQTDGVGEKNNKV